MTKTELTKAVNARLAEQNTALTKLDDETALDVAVLFPVWAVGSTYVQGDRRRYNNKLFRCEQTHVAQADWTPDATPALWTEIAKPGEIPVWRQPAGAQDAYNTGDKVHYPTEYDPVYESTVDANVWAPDVYGWGMLNG